MRAVAVILATLAFVPVASAQTTPKCTEALTLRFGQTVPCLEGILMPTEWALEATRLKTVTIPELKNRLQLLETTSTARINALTLELKVERDFSTEQARLLDKALDTYRPEPWWKHPGVRVTVGLVVGAATTIGITYAVNSD